MTVNPVTGSVLAYWKTREAHQALLTYLQGLETHPIAARRVRAKKKVGHKKETQALAQETEKSFTQAARHIGDLFGRVFSGMPVVEIVKRTLNCPPKTSFKMTPVCYSVRDVPAARTDVKSPSFLFSNKR